jgi:CrcB protein
MQTDEVVFDRRRPTSLPVLAAVAVGGALGAGLRWAVARAYVALAEAPGVGGWPWPTLIVNLVGAFAIGLVAARLDRGSAWWAFAVTGLLGGFTTYSSFAVELDHLHQADRTATAAIYAVVTIAGGVTAVAVATTIGGRRDGVTAR